MTEKYYSLDASGKEISPLVMDRQAVLAQIDVCGYMVNYVNEYASSEKVREHLNKATYELRQAFIAEQELSEGEE